VNLLPTIIFIFFISFVGFSYGQSIERSVVSSYVDLTTVEGSNNISPYRLDNFATADVMLVSGFQQGNFSGILSVHPSEFNSVIVYPNPFTESLNFRNVGSEEISVDLFNSLGQLITTKRFRGDVTLTFPALERGCYFMMITYGSHRIEIVKLNKQ
jgi:hypothetical protein